MSIVRAADGNFIWIASFLCLLCGHSASAQTCLVDAPRYSLTGDTVSWVMTIASGRSCLHGVRFANIQFERLELLSPPQSGVVELQGSGFIYSPAADFRGEDAFSLGVLGVIKGKRGNSTIKVVVTVASSGSRNANSPAVMRAPASSLSDHSSDSRDNSPPAVSIVTPTEGARISGSSVALVADASDNVAVAYVQFIVSGKNVSSAVNSPPYATVWDSTAVPDGSYMLYAVAQDTSGNYGTSSVRITVRNK